MDLPLITVWGIWLAINAQNFKNKEIPQIFCGVQGWDILAFVKQVKDSKPSR
jgi:hypothetical protein